ncbi:hypothetical protein KA405_05070 [Patescibacteria group bacterium]|nr:hypothetical protein [Patescibacteria group bacterium]
MVAIHAFCAIERSCSMSLCVLVCASALVLPILETAILSKKISGSAKTFHSPWTEILFIVTPHAVVCVVASFMVTGLVERKYAPIIMANAMIIDWVSVVMGERER